jgi:hypothetical protein
MLMSCKDSPRKNRAFPGTATGSAMVSIVPEDSQGTKRRDSLF